MSGLKRFYSLPSIDKHRYEISTFMSDDNEHEFLAEECAEDFCDNHDGWMSSWPIIIALHDSANGPEIVRFLTTRESLPQFSATEIEK